MERSPDLERISGSIPALDPLTVLRSPLKLRGDHHIPRILPGPMEGVMTPWFCHAAAALDLTDGWMTPFFRLSDNLPRKRKFTEFLTPFLDSGKPVILQLMGCDAALMADAAALAAANFQLCGIDVNFACPSPTVLRSGGGGAMLRHPATMVKIICAMRQALPELPLSVKLRTGYESEQEMAGYLPELAAAGVDLISIHFRTVKEVYSQAPGRKERLTRAVELAGAIPVFGSGDVYAITDAQEMLSCGCAGIMGARGWLRDPWLLRRLGNPHEDMTTDKGREAFWGELMKQASALPEPRPRPGLTGLAAYMWGGQNPRFRALLKLSDQEFWNGGSAEGSLNTGNSDADAVTPGNSL